MELSCKKPSCPIRGRRSGKKDKWLLEHGDRIMAEIDDVMLNTSINMNGRNPYVMYCHYKAPDGTVHEFKSRSLWCARYDLPQKGKVPVYVEGLNYKKYVVDVEHAEPEEEKE